MATPTIYRTTSTTPSIDAPRGICINPDLAQVIICDSGNDRLSKCKITGVKFIENITDYEIRELNKDDYAYTDTDFSTPSAITYYDGYYYVCDAGNHTVVRLKASDMSYGGHFGTSGTSGSSTSLLNTPIAICHDRQYLYVCDSGNSRIMKLDIIDLSYDSNSSSINGSLDTPSGICYDEKVKALFISDTANGRVVKCQTDFTYIEQNSASMTSPLHLATENDYLYICDTNQIIVLSVTGLTATTTYSDSTVTLSTPYGIAIYRRAMYIADGGGDRITVWKTYHPRDSLTASSKAKFGGVLGNNPMIVLGEDSVIVGATQESGTVNRWKEENELYTEVGWLEE